MTTDERLENLERELARAKRRNRWLLAAVGLCALAATAALGPAACEPVAARTVRAERFELVDGQGNVRAVLTMNMRAVLGLYEDGPGVDPDGPGLVLFDAAGEPRAGLTMIGDTPCLDMWDAAGKVRVKLDVAANFLPRLILWDGAGKSGACLSVIDAGVPASGPGLDLFDAPGKTRARLSVGTDGPALRLLDNKEKAIWMAP